MQQPYATGSDSEPESPAVIRESVAASIAELKADLHKRVDSLCDTIQERTQAVLLKELGKLEKEKAEIEEFRNALLDFSKRKGSEKVKLNVGGTIFMTTIATLTKEQSMLAAMFSSQFNTQPDEQGEYFIDRNPKHFGLLLDYLRTNQVITTGLTPRDLEEIKLELEFYQLRGLENLLIGQKGEEAPSILAKVTGCFKWNLRGNNDFKLSDDGTTLNKVGRTDYISTVKTSEGFTEGRHVWDIIIDNFVGDDFQVGVVDSTFPDSQLLTGWMKDLRGANQVGVTTGDRFIRCRLDLSSSKQIVITFRDSEGNLRGAFTSQLSPPIYPAVSIRAVGNRCTIVPRKK